MSQLFTSGGRSIGASVSVPLSRISESMITLIKFQVLLEWKEEEEQGMGIDTE